MLRAWWARLWGVSDTVDTSRQREPSLEVRVTALEENLDYLRGELRRLRGRVTGGLRGPEGREDALGGTNGPPPGSGVSPQTWHRLTPQERENLLARRVRAVPHG